MTRRPMSTAAQTLLAVWAALLLGVGATAGQDLTAPTVAELEALVESAESMEGAEGETLLTRYRDALAAATRAVASQARAEAYTQEAAEAPALVESLQAELAIPLEEVDLQLAPSVTLDELEAEQKLARAATDAARASLAEIESLAAFRKKRRAELPQEITATTQATADSEQALGVLPGAAVTDGRQTLLLSQLEEYRAQLARLEAEQNAYDVRRELLPLRRDAATRRLAQAEAVSASWKEAVDELRAAEGDAAAQETGQKLNQLAFSFPGLEDLSEDVRALRALRSGDTGLPNRIAEAQVARQAIRGELKETDNRYLAARRRLDAGGLTEAMGYVLRQDFEWLPTSSQLKVQATRWSDQLARTQLDLLTAEEQRARVSDISAAVEQLVMESPQDIEATEEFQAAARDLFEEMRDAADAALEDIETLTTALYDNKELGNRYRQSVHEYRGFIEENILWVRSSPLPSIEFALGFPGNFFKIIEAASELQASGLVEKAIGDHPVQLVFLTLFLAALVAGRRFLRKKRSEMASLVRSYRTDRYLYTVRALVQTILIALTMPLAAWLLGTVLAASEQDLLSAAGFGLRETAYAWWALRFLMGLLAEKGVGAAHFRWPISQLAAARKEIRWFEPLAVGFGFLYLTLDGQSEAEWSDSIGRASFIVTMVATACLSHRLLGESSGLWNSSSTSGVGLLGKTRRLWSLVATGLPAMLAILALWGFYYTALQFELRLRYSIGLAIGLVLVNGLLLRWLFLIRRRLAVEQALESKARRDAESEESISESGSPQIDADQLDIPAVDAQTRKLFKSSITLSTMLGLYLIWASVLPALQALDRVQILPTPALVSESSQLEPTPSNADAPSSSPTPQSTLPGIVVDAPEDAESSERASATLGLPATLTLADVLLALVFLILTSVAAKNLPALLELALLQRLPLDSGARYAITTIVRYLILLIGLSAISGAVGIGWQQVQWLAAALTFGLAFGLQEIFANFVSGLIILIERPIRVGDIVTVGGTEGRVTQLRMRATTIQDWDRREYLVPNKEFITASVINWTLTDPVTRIVIPVGIAYGSDTKLARRLLKKVAAKNPLSLDDPAPSAIFRSFGASSLDFELRVFIANRDLWPQIVDSLHSEIDAAFREADIEIAFPQRDIHVRSVTGMELPGAAAQES